MNLKSHSRSFSILCVYGNGIWILMTVENWNFFPPAVAPKFVFFLSWLFVCANTYGHWYTDVIATLISYRKEREMDSKIKFIQQINGIFHVVDWLNVMVNKWPWSMTYWQFFAFFVLLSFFLRVKEKIESERGSMKFGLLEVHIWDVNKSNLFFNGARKPERTFIHPNGKESNGKYWIMRIHLIGMSTMIQSCYFVLHNIVCHLRHRCRGCVLFFSFLRNSDFVANAFVFQFTSVWLWHPPNRSSLCWKFNYENNGGNFDGDCFIMRQMNAQATDAFEESENLFNDLCTCSFHKET